MQQTTTHQIAMIPNFLELSLRQQEILIYLYRFRFLTSLQIQLLLKQNWHHRTRVWLNTLQQNGYLEGIYTPSTKTGRTPTIYYLKKNGFRFIQSLIGTNSYLRKMQNENLPRFSLHIHCLKTADIALYIANYYEKYSQSLRIYTKADIANTRDYRLIRPDLFITSKNESLFIELDLETESFSTILKKQRSYIQHLHTFDWHYFSSDLYPCTIYITTSEQRAKKLQILFEDLLMKNGYPSVTIKTTTLSDFFNLGLEEDICYSPFNGDEKFLFI